MQQWSPTSWQAHAYQQQPHYPCAHALEDAVSRLAQLPPLVTSYEVDNLQRQLAQAAIGKSFVLQGGDCAESFMNCHADTITNQLKILLQMSLILLHGLRTPIIRVGRIAGQYAKPRSSDNETRDGKQLPSYRGDLVNHIEFTKAGRTPDPQLLLQGYSHAAMTLNFLRALINSGFADLQHPEYWDIDFVQHSPMAKEYHGLVNLITNALNFVETIAGVQQHNLNRVDFYTSHEALHLHYEQALTRQGHDGKWYNLSTHFPWIGMRTANENSAHIEYMRGINNPVGIKIGPNTSTQWLRELLNILDPHNVPGRLTLITRFGAANIAEQLPPVITAVQQTGKAVVWSCDPMHGNTHSTPSNLKTRHFNDILSELRQAFTIHKQMHSHLSGVHFELTGDNVTECTGGARGLNEDDLKRAYKSLVDPRLNYEQALEMAMLIANAPPI